MVHATKPSLAPWLLKALEACLWNDVFRSCFACYLDCSSSYITVSELWPQLVMLPNGDLAR